MKKYVNWLFCRFSLVVKLLTQILLFLWWRNWKCVLCMWTCMWDWSLTLFCDCTSEEVLQKVYIDWHPVVSSLPKQGNTPGRFLSICLLSFMFHFCVMAVISKSFSILAMASFMQNWPLNWWNVSFSLYFFCSVLLECVVVIRLFCLLLCVVVLGFYCIYYYFQIAVFKIVLYVLLLVLIS